MPSTVQRRVYPERNFCDDGADPGIGPIGGTSFGAEGEVRMSGSWARPALTGWRAPPELQPSSTGAPGPFFRIDSIAFFAEALLV